MTGTQTVVFFPALSRSAEGLRSVELNISPPLRPLTAANLSILLPSHPPPARPSAPGGSVGRGGPRWAEVSAEFRSQPPPRPASVSPRCGSALCCCLLYGYITDPPSSCVEHRRRSPTTGRLGHGQQLQIPYPTTTHLRRGDPDAS